MKSLLRLFSLISIISIISILCSCTDKKSSTKSKTGLYDRYKPLVHSINVAAYNASKNYLLLVDYSIPSNKPRFFVWDLKQDKIIHSFWCAHGCGGNSTDEKPEFSNAVGSNCSSLGLFIVDKWEGESVHYGYKYHGVDGLSPTNSNARIRQILIHAWASVTNDYNNQIATPMSCDMRSEGCFTTTDVGYRTIHNIIKNENKSVLLYSFNGVSAQGRSNHNKR